MTDQPLPADPTLDEVRAALAPLLAAEAAFDGWGKGALGHAARRAGVDPDIAALAFPGGATDMIDAWFAHIDRAMLTDLPPERLAGMKIRDRITALVQARVDILAPDREALRRARGILALPQNLALAARLGWRAADAMWRAAGDTATDYNHYTKRMTLGAVYASTVTVMLDDDSEDLAETRGFLSRRIDNVMQFEKWKARATGSDANRPSLARFIGRLRYPAR